MSLDDLSKKIGYEFADIKLLELAITHKSADSKSNNERLEFLGDAILSTVVSEYLYTKFPYQKEGLLTRMRSHLVKGDTLTRIAYKLELTNFIKLSKGTANLSSERKQSILEGVVEAIIGAVMLDSNWETSKKFVLKLLKKELSKISIDKEFRDSKTELQELLQSKKLTLLFMRPQNLMMALNLVLNMKTKYSKPKAILKEMQKEKWQKKL